jgi:hypothetical protein
MRISTDKGANLYHDPVTGRDFWEPSSYQSDTHCLLLQDYSMLYTVFSMMIQLGISLRKYFLYSTHKYFNNCTNELLYHRMSESIAANILDLVHVEGK